jgi:hypothetical protein
LARLLRLAARQPLTLRIGEMQVMRIACRPVRPLPGVCSMLQRRQSHRFTVPPGGDQALVVGEGRSGEGRAKVLDTSAGGLALRIEGPWIPEVGQKVEVELSNHDVTLARVVRVERDSNGAVLGLLRLADDPTDDPQPGAVVPLGTALKRRRRPWLLSKQGQMALLPLTVGLVAGLIVWRARSAGNGPSPAPQQVEIPAPSTAGPQPPRAETKPKDMESAATPQPVGTPHAPRAAAPVSVPIDVDIEAIVRRLPRNIQFQFRQLETQTAHAARSVGTAAQRRMQQRLERLAEQLKAAQAQSGGDVARLEQAAQPLLDEARREIATIQTGTNGVH